MSGALDLLHPRLAATALAPRGFSLDASDDLLALAHRGVDTGLRARVRVVRVPRLDALVADGRWIEATVDPALLAPADAPVVLIVLDADGRAVWATREELVARAVAGSPQARFSALAGLGGAGLHRLLLVLAADALGPALAAPLDPGLPGAVRTRALLRRFVDHGEAVGAPPADLDALGVPPWFVAAHANGVGDFATPEFTETLDVELRGPVETLAVRGCALRCTRGGALSSTWTNDHAAAPLGFALRIDHARATLELRASLRGATASASGLAAAARFVWRFGQGGHVALVPGSAAAGVTVGAAVGPQPVEAVPHAMVETLEALAAVERAAAVTFAVSPAALADPAQAEGVRELLRVRSSGRIDRSLAAMRLTLAGAELGRLLDAAGGQRRVTFGLPASTASATVLGATVPLGRCTREVSGTLVAEPAALAGALASLPAGGSIEVELSAVEVRERYAPPAAPTTAPTATRGAPSGSRSGST